MHKNTSQPPHLVLRLLSTFATTLRIIGLYPYSSGAHGLVHSPQLSWKWRIYSACCLSFYLFAFTIFCVYAMGDHMAEQSEDHLMDFVRISEILLITVMLLAIIITEQCFYGPCAQVLINLHRVLRDIFEDISSGDPDTETTAPLKQWFSRNMVTTSFKFVIRAVALMMVCVSIAYTKFLSVLEYFPWGWNYLGMSLLLVPFIALSLSSSKFCAYVHAFDHGFQMLNKQIKLKVDELNGNEAELRQECQKKQSSSVMNLESHKNSGALLPVPDIYSCLLEGSNLIKSDRRRRGLLFRKQKLVLELQQSVFRIRGKHDALCLLVEEFFQHWGLYMLLFLTLYFSLFVIEAFFLFTNVYKSVRSGLAVDQQYAWMNLRSCLLVVIELTWTIGSCSSLMASIQRISVTLNALVMPDMDGGLVQSIETWTIKLLSQPNAVQVFQLFDINNGLLFSIIGAVCGYLVILIQFKLAE